MREEAHERYYAVSPVGVEAIERAVRASLNGSGRVSAETLAEVLAEHEPEKHRQQPREMSDSQYEQMFEACFGHTVHEAAPTSADDEYQLDFARRFGFEAS